MLAHANLCSEYASVCSDTGRLVLGIPYRHEVTEFIVLVAFGEYSYKDSARFRDPVFF